MSNFPPEPDDDAPAEVDETPDPSVVRAERRLRLLEELAEIGMELARTLRPGAQTVGAGEPAVGEEPAPGRAGRARDPAEAFGPLSRAIRLTLALEGRTDAELRDLKAGVTRARAQERAQAAERARIALAKARQSRIDQIRECVERVAEAEMPDGEALDVVCDTLAERLLLEEEDLGCPERPLREVVERLCADFALSPDWSRWTGEDWSDDGPPARPETGFDPSGGSITHEAGPQPPGASIPPSALHAGHDLE